MIVVQIRLGGPVVAPYEDGLYTGVLRGKSFHFKYVSTQSCERFYSLPSSASVCLQLSMPTSCIATLVRTRVSSQAAGA
jgi:hypothetical protein